MDYFSQKEWVSNSFLKSIKGTTMPENIERIFEFGSLVHAYIFEPEKANMCDTDFELARQMGETFYKDKLCSFIMRNYNIKSEHEFYKKVDGLQRRCKADAVIKDIGLILEFKGLSVTSEKQFIDSISHFDYDMGAAWYIDTANMNRELIVGVSKKKPNMLFKFMIEKGDRVYKEGRRKYIQAISEGILKGKIKNQIYNTELLQKIIDEV